ncbi:MAG: hypothetical protein KY476_06930 [Planctomycetes bacterium]|nr:hypothetical protein [Planctomycetota bacterium]
MQIDLLLYPDTSGCAPVAALDTDPALFPACREGRMIRIDTDARPSVAEILARPLHFDTL